METPVLPTLDQGVVGNFALALLIGALVGIEREKRKTEEGDVGTGGLRTFVLFALIGAIAGWLSHALATPWILVGGLVAVAMAIVVGYAIEAHTRPGALGLTTELAAIAVYLLGAMTTLGYRELAVGLAIVTAAVLAYKQPLHGFVAKIGWSDVFAGLRLMIATFIVLPLLPDRAVDPWEALNPHTLWLLVLLISGLSLVGYVATRLLGAHRGAALTGVTGGLVSSTAVTLSFSRQSRDQATAAGTGALAGGILLAWCVMFGRILVEVLVVNPQMLTLLLAPVTAMGLIAAGMGGLYLWRGLSRQSREPSPGTAEVPLTNPFSLASAAKVAAFFAFVTLVVKIVQAESPGGGVYIVAALAGLTDVDAITLSMAEFAKHGDTSVAVRAIIIAALANTLTKCGMVLILAGPPLRRPIALATAAIVAAGLAALVLG
jgi:uncharacterized membrane protein (DUF4010 family)